MTHEMEWNPARINPVIEDAFNRFNNILMEQNYPTFRNISDDDIGSFWSGQNRSLKRHSLWYTFAVYGPAITTITSINRAKGIEIPVPPRISLIIRELEKGERSDEIFQKLWFEAIKIKTEYDLQLKKVDIPDIQKSFFISQTLDLIFTDQYRYWRLL